MTLMTGERFHVIGTVEEVEATIIAASRGSIMQFAWLNPREGDRIGVNPAAVVSLRVGES
jgi:hypothetical protein